MEVDKYNLESGIRAMRLVVQMLTTWADDLEADNIPAGVNFPAIVRATLSGIEWFLYSTHRHTPEAPRFRLMCDFAQQQPEVRLQLDQERQAKIFNIFDHFKTEYPSAPAAAGDGTADTFEENETAVPGTPVTNSFER